VSWLPLLERLTTSVPSWLVWKNADAALAGHGDVDSSAPESAWGAVASEFSRWAVENELGPVLTCTHPPKTMFLVAVDFPNRSLVELDVLGRKYFRGGTLFEAGTMAPLARLDRRGVRRLRPGAEALIIMLTNGMSWGGAPDAEALAARGVRALLRSDPGGAERAAEVFGLPSGPVAALAREASHGSWDRRAAALLEAAALGKAVADPAILARRVRFRLATKKTCPVLRSIFYRDRDIGPDPEAWLREARRSHPMVGAPVAGGVS
jgi:hypothetical protein